jgi:hypothetical protein
MRRPRRSLSRSLSLRRLTYLMIMLALPTLFGVCIAGALWKRPYAANVRLNLTVSRFGFKLESASLGDELLRSLVANSVAMSNIETVEFDARRLRIADPVRFDQERNIYRADAWKPIPLVQPRVIFQAKDASSLPFVRIQPDQVGTMALDPIRVNVRSQVVLEVPEQTGKPTGAPAKIGASTANDARPVELRATIELKERTLNISTKGSVQVRTRELRLLGSAPTSSIQPATYAVELDPKNSKIKIATLLGPLDLFLVPTSDFAHSLLSGRSLQLSHPEFLRFLPNVVPQSTTNSSLYISSLLAEADNRLTYVDYPKRAIEHFPKEAFLHFNDDATLTLTQLSISPVTGGFQIELQGRPSSIYITSDSVGMKTYQMNLLEYVGYALESSPLKSLFILSTWLVSTTLAAHRLVKELQKEVNA